MRVLTAGRRLNVGRRGFTPSGQPAEVGDGSRVHIHAADAAKARLLVSDASMIMVKAFGTGT